MPNRKSRSSFPPAQFRYGNCLVQIECANCERKFHSADTKSEILCPNCVREIGVRIIDEAIEWAELNPESDKPLSEIVVGALESLGRDPKFESQIDDIQIVSNFALACETYIRLRTISIRNLISPSKFDKPKLLRQIPGGDTE